MGRFRLPAWTFPGFVIVVLTAYGCGRSDRPSFHRVSGRVTYEGEPLADATLMLQRISGEKMEFARRSICLSKPDGTFEPYTMQEGDGLPAGVYAVGITAQEWAGGPPLTEGISDEEYARIRWKSKIPAHYSDPRTSGVQIEVTPSGIVPEVIELTSGAG